MPIPKPQGERQAEYIAKCYKAIKGEYPTAQAFAICYQKWKDRNKI